VIEVSLAQVEAFARVGGALCLDFVNTEPSRGTPWHKDYLLTSTHLAVWLRGAGLDPGLGDPAVLSGASGNIVLASARKLRDALHAIFHGLATGSSSFHPDSLAVVNRHLRNAAPHRVLTHRRGGFAWAWRSNDVAERFLWPIGLSAAELLISGRIGRVRECAGVACGFLFLDTTRNGSRRWCEMEVCGNRAKARQSYRRKLARTAHDSN
jgi:predicted RNA-binding Zn ribbon-like protein